MRMIDADKLVKAIKDFRWFGVPNTLKLMFDYLKIIIRDQPTVDAVEVVYCKNCVWRQQDDINRNFCGLGDFYCGETDYCSRGERKDNA